MASSLSNHRLLPVRSSSSSSSSPLPKPPISQSIQFTTLRKPILGISFSSYPPPLSPIPISSRNRKFPALAAQQSAPQTNVEVDDGRKSKGEAIHQNLNKIIGMYKMALLNRDYEAVSELERRIFSIEKEKNQLKQEVESLSSEISSGKAICVRLQADFDNYRKRIQKEEVTKKSDAQKQVIERLLAVVDNFEKAKQYLKPETEKETKIETSYRGIYKQFVEALRNFQVAIVPTIGKPFDPKVHEAVGREASVEFKEGIVTQELQRGFLLGDRVLRPARVKVSSGPGSKKGSVVAEEPTEEHATTAAVDER